MTILAPIIVFASGTVGDTIHSRNGAGPYTRPHVNPVQPDTLRQTRIRDRLGLLSVRWGATLTKPQRAAWATYAANVPVGSVSGRTQFLTGQQMYIRCNMPRGAPAVFAIDDAPTAFNHGTQVTISVTDLLAAGQLDMTFDTGAEWVTEDGAFLYLQASDSRPTTVSFFAGPFRFSRRIAGNSATPPTSPISAPDPFPLHLAGRRWSRHRIGYADGRLTRPVITVFAGI